MVGDAPRSLLKIHMCSYQQYGFWFHLPLSTCRNRILMCILNMCKEILGGIPKVVGIDIVEMALWAKVHLKGNSFSAVTHNFWPYPLQMVCKRGYKIGARPKFRVNIGLGKKLQLMFPWNKYYTNKGLT